MSPDHLYKSTIKVVSYMKKNSRLKYPASLKNGKLYESEFPVWITNG